MFVIYFLVIILVINELYKYKLVINELYIFSLEICYNLYF